MLQINKEKAIAIFTPKYGCQTIYSLKFSDFIDVLNDNLSAILHDPSKQYEPGQFFGTQYDEKKDAPRLKKQLLAIFKMLEDGNWRTMAKFQDDARVIGIFGESATRYKRYIRKWKYFDVYFEERRNENGKREFRMVFEK